MSCGEMGCGMGTLGKEDNGVCPLAPTERCSPAGPHEEGITRKQQAKLSKNTEDEAAGRHKDKLSTRDLTADSLHC